MCKSQGYTTISMTFLKKQTFINYCVEYCETARE